MGVAPGSGTSHCLWVRFAKGPSQRPSGQLPPSLFAHPDMRECVQMPMLSWGPGARGDHVCGVVMVSGPEGLGCPWRPRAQHEVVLAGNPLISHPQERAGTGRRGNPACAAVGQSRPLLEGSNRRLPDVRCYRALSGYTVHRTVWGPYQQDPHS